MLLVLSLLVLSLLLEEAPNLYSNLQIYIASRAHGKAKEERKIYRKEEKKNRERHNCMYSD